MAAIIDTLIDENDNIVYPQTRTNAVLDSNNVDVDTKITDLQNQLTPTAWTNATSSSNILGGLCMYAKIGKLVLVHMEDVTIKSGVASQGSLLFSGLPQANQGFITIASSHTNYVAPIRFYLSVNGEITLHYSETGSFGDGNAHHYADFCYIAS